jgi:protein phosphatase-4 regulatory subunit 3
MLDDPTFGILNGFVFFNQVDIINHITGNEAFLQDLFSGFKDDVITPGKGKDRQREEEVISPETEKMMDIVLFLHQLVVMGKGIQVASRLALYRTLLDHGLLLVVEWAFRRSEAQLLHAGGEILTLVTEHDVNAVRMNVMKEEEGKRKTLVMEIIDLMGQTDNLGLMSQMADGIRVMIDGGSDEVSMICGGGSHFPWA